MQRSFFSSVVIRHKHHAARPPVKSSLTYLGQIPESGKPPNIDKFQFAPVTSRIGNVVATNQLKIDMSPNYSTSTKSDEGVPMMTHCVQKWT